MTGIYSITNITNQKKYIGSSGCIEKRFNQHKSDLKRQVHSNSFLQNSWNLYGQENFTFEILEFCFKEHLLAREEHWIAKLNTSNDNFGYNLSPWPRRPRLGRKSSPETIKKMSISNGGKNHPNWGKKLSADHVANIKKCQLGIPKPTSGKRKSIIFLSPMKEKIVVYGLREFCRIHNLSAGMMSQVGTMKRKEHKGWTIYQ